MNKHIIIILFILIHLVSYSQDYKKIDSLKKALTNEKTVENVKILNNLAFHYHKINTDSGLFYSFAALKISKLLKNDTLTAVSHNRLATNYWAKFVIDSAIIHSKIALKIGRKLTDSAIIADSYRKIAFANASDAKYNIALKYYDTTYKYIKHNDDDFRADVEISRGIAYFNLSNNQQALKHYLIAAKYYEKQNNKLYLSYIYTLLGNIYVKTDDEKNGLQYLKKALRFSRELKNILDEATALENIAKYYMKIKKYKKALTNLKKALKLSDKITSKIFIVDLYSDMGKTYLELNLLDSAKYYYNNAIQIANKQNDDWAKMESNIGMAKVNIQKKEYNKAIINLKKAQIYAIQIDSKEFIKDIYENFAKAYKGLRRYKKAVEFNEKYVKLTDSLYNEKSAKQLANMKVSYETEKKENENAKLKIEKKLNEETIENHKTINIAILIVIILSALLIIVLFLNRKKIKNTNKSLLFKNQQIQQQKEEITIQSENLEGAYTNLKELQDFKNGLIGMIVHDLKNPLNIIINMSENKFVTDSGYKMLNMVNNILDVEKYEDISMPINQVNFNLRDLFQQSISKNNFLALLQKIKINNNIEKSIEVNADKEIIERVIDNLLTNAIKFSPQAGNIDINVKIDKNYAYISITDEGVGISKEFQKKIFDKFVQAEVKKSGIIRSTGLGLTFCKLAMEAHNCTIKIYSKQNEGATFTFSIPVIDN